MWIHELHYTSENELYVGEIQNWAHPAHPDQEIAAEELEGKKPQEA
jgi:hypothetical protein